MEESDVREVEQVVVDQSVVRLVVHSPRLHRPAWIVYSHEIRNQFFIGTAGIAHPDPCNRVLVANRIAADLNLRRNFRLTGDLDTSARRCELESVVHASEILAFKPAHRQWGQSMAAPVLQGNRRLICCAVKYYRLIKNR